MTSRDPRAHPSTSRWSEALRSLPRHRPGDGFTDEILDRLARAEAPPRRRPSLRPTLRWAAAGLLLGTVVLGGLLLPDGAPPTERSREEPREARLEALRTERARLAAELAELRRLTDEIHREPAPVLYLGGDEEMDLVLDLGRLARGGDDYRLTAYDQEEDRP